MMKAEEGDSRARDERGGRREERRGEERRGGGDRKDQTVGLLTLLDLLLLTDWIESEFLSVKRYLVSTCCFIYDDKKAPSSDAC